MLFPLLGQARSRPCRVVPMLVMACTGFVSLACAGTSADSQPVVLSDGAASPSAPATSPPSTAPTTPPRRPVVGECRADGSAVVRDAASDEQPPVPCARPHSLETWRVVDLPAEWATRTRPADDTPSDPAPTGSTTGSTATGSTTTQPTPGTTPTPHQEIADAFDALCPRDDFSAWVGIAPSLPTFLGTKVEATAVKQVYFYPTDAEWSAGARWMRCDGAVDVGQTARPDYDWSGPLPDHYRAALPTDDIRGICYGPPDAAHSSPHVPCSAPHVLEIMHTYLAPAGPWPAPASPAYARWSEVCSTGHDAFTGPATGDGPGTRFLHGVVTDVGSAERWAGGYRAVACMFSYRKDAATPWITVGSARSRGDADPVLAE